MDTAVVRAEVFCFEHTPGIVNGCRACGSNHNKGTWAIRVKVDGDDTKYYLGVSKPYPICCGQEKPTYIQIFQTLLVAKKVATEAQLLADTVGIDALNLVSHHAYMQNAIE